MSTTTDTFINKRIGRYEIRERIGTGGMARVFKGWDTNLDRTVAIKILHEHLTEAPTFKERFEREAKLVASLNHPNIVQIYDYSITDFNGQTISYMVMPLIPGKTLKDILEDLSIRSDRMERSQDLLVMLDLTSALAYAHSRGMVHRDVKPGNIMFDEHGHAILTDFGIARLKETTSLTQEGATVGTPIYLSPEQAVGRPVDSRSDLYAVGIILYEMLAGVPPFNDESSISIILKHMNAPIPSISQQISVADPDLDAIIYKALAKNPDDRYPTAQAFADDVKRILSKPVSPPQVLQAQTMPKIEVTYTQPLPVPAASTLPQPASTTLASPRFSLNIVAFAVAAVALIIVIAFVLSQRPQPGAATPTEEAHVSSMTGNQNIYFLSTFASDDVNNTGWPQTAEGSILRQITPDGFYHFQNQLRNTAATAIFNPENTYQDGTITLNGTLESTSPPDSGYGIVFRYMDELNYNVFAVDGRGRYSIWSLANGSWHELRDATEKWTPDNFIKPLGQTNQITVTFVGNHLIGSVNNEMVSDVQVDAQTVKPGAIGIYLGTTDSSGAGVLVDTYEITNTIPSMTGTGQ